MVYNSNTASPYITHCSTVSGRYVYDDLDRELVERLDAMITNSRGNVINLLVPSYTDDGTFKYIMLLKELDGSYTGYYKDSSPKVDLKLPYCLCAQFQTIISNDDSTVKLKVDNMIDLIDAIFATFSDISYKSLPRPKKRKLIDFINSYTGNKYNHTSFPHCSNIAVLNIYGI